jgi:hypothetical protein
MYAWFVAHSDLLSGGAGERAKRKKVSWYPKRRPSGARRLPVKYHHSWRNFG